MENKVYLIHEEDYVKHIRDKDRLFWLLKHMIKQVIDLQPNRDNKELLMSAIRIGCDIDREYVSWGIPVGFKGTADELQKLMENELIAPEDAGYYACDDTCCCQCGCCCENCDLYDDDEDYDGEDYDDYDEAEDETDVDDNFAELMAGLSSIAQSIFGDNVSVHIVVE
jgi:hypothetical protein